MSNEQSFYANPEHQEVEAAIRFQSVKRWHMIETARTQSLAEHSANVAVLAYGIARTSPGMYFGPAGDLVAAALFHDMPEVFTGDIPSHTKFHLSGLDALENRVLPTVFWVVPRPEVQKLIKMCDLADGIRFIRIHGVDLTANHARDGLVAQFTKLASTVKWPPVVLDHALDWLNFYIDEQ